MYATDLARSGQYRVRRVVEPARKGPITETPSDLNQLRKIFHQRQRIAQRHRAMDRGAEIQLPKEGFASACGLI